MEREQAAWPVDRTSFQHNSFELSTAPFWTLVDRSAGPVGCWLWCRGRDAKGYGQFAADGRKQQAHRFAYTDAIGPIPMGYKVRQECRNPACVNPTHLRLVTPTEHHERIIAPRRDRTHCPQGHPYDAANTYWWRGTRKCRTCQRARDRAAYQRRTAAGDVLCGPHN